MTDPVAGIVQDGLDPSHAAIVAEKMRAIVTVRTVESTFRLREKDVIAREH